MTLSTIAILSPGDMGHGVGKALNQHGYDIITCLSGRSQRTKDLSRAGGIRDVPTLESLVEQADLILSILVPAYAATVADSVASAIQSIGVCKPYADCNAVSPETSRTIDATITSAGGDYIDAGIIGGSPARGAEPRFYTSGPHADVMNELDGKGIAIRNVGGEIGRASSIKMCYASFTKGTSALQVAMMTAAQSLGVFNELVAELRFSQEVNLTSMESNVPRLPSNAGRWVGEMEEIAATFASTGVTPYFHKGAADIFNLLESTPFAQESPETIDQSRTLAETIKVVEKHLTPKVQTGD